MENVFPEFVDKETTGYLSLAYDNFGVIAIKGIQELYKIIDEKDKQIENLIISNRNLEQRLSVLEEFFSKQQFKNTSASIYAKP